MLINVDRKRAGGLKQRFEKRNEVEFQLKTFMQIVINGLLSAEL